jgi:NAD(P)-dependent dehydrogenase (short-subunit alcohol dehydrogenase family)
VFALVPIGGIGYNGAMSDSLGGRVVLVTGGNGGIGLGIAEGCARAGADLVIWGTNREKLTSARERLNSLGADVLAQQVDVADEQAVIEAFAHVVTTVGSVDCAVANAGVHGGGPFVDLSLKEWRRIMAVNLEGAVVTLREAARHMIGRGEGGSLIGVSSTSAIHGAPGSQAYAASKAGILAVMRGLSVELARHNIRCNTIVPGWTETEMTEVAQSDEKFLAATIRRTPIRRWGRPDDFGAVAAFLADPTQLYHTGDEIVIDGGYTRF